jgi:type I restriction enzyme S subunit
LTYADREYCIGRGVAAIAVKNAIHKEYVYLFLNDKLDIVTSEAAGSVIVGLSKPDILDLRTLLPQESVIDEFHTGLQDLFAKKELSGFESDSLSVR